MASDSASKQISDRHPPEKKNSAQSSSDKGTSEKFRRQLRQEAEHWWQEGLIDAQIYESLSQRYQFRQIEGEASNRLIGVLLGLGAVLLGLGAITFVAANWNGLTRIVKVAILLSGFVGINTLGFYLWRTVGTTAAALSRRRWGQALLILGALLLGANLGLLPQMFHQGGPVYGLLLMWGLCVAIMSYALRLTSLGVMALILVTTGYAWGLSEVGFFSFLGSQVQPTPGFWLIQAMPLLLIGLFLPLAYVCRSRLLFGLMAIATVVTFNTNLTWNGMWSQGWVLSFIFLPPALLWAFDRRMWRLSGVWRTRPALREAPPPLHLSFTAIARVIALVLLCFNLYGLSFHGLWESYPETRDFWGSAVVERWPLMIDEVGLGAIALLAWIQLSKQFPGFNQLQFRALNSAMVLLLIVVPLGLHLYSSWVQPLPSGMPIAATLTINILLALLALGLLRDGLALGWRSCFWGGMVLLVLDILTRMFEYDTGLLAKAFAFMLCGVGVMLAGIWFERKARRRRSPRLASTPSAPA